MITTNELLFWEHDGLSLEYDRNVVGMLCLLVAHIPQQLAMQVPFKTSLGLCQFDCLLVADWEL